MLHIIRSSGFTSNALTQCLSMVLAQDSILLMDDGCYNVNHPLLHDALATNPNTTVYFVDLHASARALTPISSNSQNNSNGYIGNAFIAIALSDALTHIFNHNNSITWS